jgi:hypothetical protein
MYRHTLSELRRQPANAEIEQTNPGYLDDIGAAMMPWIRLHAERIAQRYKPRVLELMRGQYSARDAAMLAAYYRTQPGREALLGGEATLDPMGQPNSFLAPAPVQNADGTRPGRVYAAAPDPAVEAYLADADLQQREKSYLESFAQLALEIAEVQPDKDVQDGLLKAIGQAATAHGVTPFAIPRS